MEAEAEAQGNGLAVGQPVKHQLRPRVGAQVASQRCPTLRTAETILGPSRGQEEPLLQSSPVRQERKRPKVGSRWAEQQRPSSQGCPGRPFKHAPLIPAARGNANTRAGFRPTCDQGGGGPHPALPRSVKPGTFLEPEGRNPCCRIPRAPPLLAVLRGALPPLKFLLPSPIGPPARGWVRWVTASGTLNLCGR